MTETKLPIYLDHHATTPLDKRVLDEMMPYYTEKFGKKNYGGRGEKNITILETH